LNRVTPAFGWLFQALAPDGFLEWMELLWVPDKEGVCAKDSFSDLLPYREKTSRKWVCGCMRGRI